MLGAYETGSVASSDRYPDNGGLSDFSNDGQSHLSMCITLKFSTKCRASIEGN